ncbi:G-protein coupled receptor moody-like [Diadema setosum]|uniref:G-protein coupled receptor moody-like n=1 Tax=Diadema setosum TaxID=31175 RepID=UPI003B3A380B
MANLSSALAPLCKDEPTDRSALDITFSVVETLFCLLAVVCNGAVVMILYQKPKLRNKSNSHLMNLVVADFLYCLTLPLTMSSTLAGGWQLGGVVCQLHGFFTLCVVLAIEFNFPMMAIYRLIVITRSQHRLADFYKMHTHGLLATTWISSALCAFPPLVGWGRFGYCNGVPDCFLTMWSSKSYVIFLLITTTVIPCIIMAFCYIQVIITVRQSSKRVRNATQNAISGSSASLAVCDDRRIRASSPAPSVLYSDRDFLPIPQNQPSNKAVAASNQRRPSAVSIVGRNRESMRRGSLASIASSTISNVRPSELRLGKSLALVTVSYVCTWLPVVVCVVRAMISADVSKERQVHLIQLFLFLHVAVNPLVYGLLNDPFKSVLAKLLCWKHPESSHETERWVPPSVASTVPQSKMADRATRQGNHTTEGDEKRTRSSLTPPDSKPDKDMQTRLREAPVSDLSTSQHSAIAGSSGKR